MLVTIMDLCDAIFQFHYIFYQEKEIYALEL